MELNNTTSYPCCFPDDRSIEVLFFTPGNVSTYIHKRVYCIYPSSKPGVTFLGRGRTKNARRWRMIERQILTVEPIFHWRSMRAFFWRLIFSCHASAYIFVRFVCWQTLSNENTQPYLNTSPFTLRNETKWYWNPRNERRRTSVTIYYHPFLIMILRLDYFQISIVSDPKEPENTTSCECVSGWRKANWYGIPKQTFRVMEYLGSVIWT